MWIRDNLPDIWNKTYKFVSPKDYVIFELTGELSTDYSSAGNLGGFLILELKIGLKKWEMHWEYQ